MRSFLFGCVALLRTIFLTGAVVAAAPTFAADLATDSTSSSSTRLIFPRGALLASVTLTTLPRTTIDAQVAAQGPGFAGLIGPALCGVRVDAMAHTSIGPRGERVTATGVVLTPVGGSANPGCTIRARAPVISYDHGTEFQRSNTLTNPNDEETQLLIAAYAAKGYVVVASDYLGYFGSTLLYHPYLHAQSEADMTVDALRAARTLLASRGMKIDKLFVTGYSQGGHASMATVRALESRYAGEFPLTASVPMSGAYALEQTFVGASITPTLFASSIAAFTLISYDRIYGDIYNQTTDVFRLPYATNIESYFPGPLAASDLFAQGVIPLDLSALLTPQFLSSFQNPDHPFRVRLRENTLLGWTPQHPMALCGGARDPLVPFVNSIVAQADFTSRGAVVGLIEVDQAFGLPPFQSQQDLLDYHIRTVPPLCAVAARTRVFDPLR
jgi:predicted esterase